MKIKELHIRNIASIEKADIDFEKELIDSVTGDPSSIFLISGDTGTGKTVILDAIAMALYKKTPRLVDVANKQNNDYTDNEGQAISINSIEQYTRLGISEKDPCYSELIFEGNDGCEYHAKLELGIVKGNTDANGNRPMKHRSPKWTYKKGTDDWQRVDTKSLILLNAVGLSFEQFGRMAMLAQGQFAAFLTGDKTERESILEQLTNTSRFTLYGKAISNLFTTAKNNKASAQTTFETEKEHTLPADELKTLSDDLSLLQKQKVELDAECRKEKARLQIVDDIETCCTTRRKAETERIRLEAVIAGEDCQLKKQLVNDWDTTNQERQQLLNKQQAEKRKLEAMQQLAIARETFAHLSSDLRFRDDELKGMKDQYDQLFGWIREHIALDDLFVNASAVMLQLVQFKDNTAKLNEAKLKLSKEKERTQPLHTRVEDCLKAEASAKAAAATKQEAITKLQKERSALNPQGISKEKDLAVRRQSDLEKLQDRIDKCDKDRQTLQQIKEEIASEELRLTQLQEVYIQSQGIYEQRVKDEASARSLLTTMQMSLEDTLTELRRKLQDTHAEICPLCGQQIDTLHITEDFERLLSPIQQREEEARLFLKTASDQRDADKTAYDKAKGVLTFKKQECERNTEKNHKEEQTVKEVAVTLQLNPDADLLPQIDEAIAKEKEHIAALVDLLNKAEELQAFITQLTNEKIPLDDAVNKAMRTLQEACNDEENNRSRIIEQEQSIAAAAGEQTLLMTTLNKQLSSYCSTWQEDVSSAQQQLKADAEAYLAKKRQAEKLSQELSRMETQQESLRSICNRILQKQKTWTQANESLEYKTSCIGDEWTKLYAQIEHQQEACNEADKTFNDASDSLSFYYAFSGRTEQDLMGIIAQEQSVAESRRQVSVIDGEHKSCCDAINNAVKTLADLFKELKVEKPEDVPARAMLQAHVEELSVKQLELAGRIGGIEEKLKTNSVNEKRFAEAKLALEKATAVYEKWDRMNKCFGGTRFRTLVQTYILRPLLNNANIYLEKITDRYTLTCSEDNEQLSILVLDRYNKNQVRSVTVLSGGERFMISLALSLALSSLNRQDMNVNILFIDEGFGTLDETNLNSVMATLEKLQEIAGQTNRRVGIISHREELVDRIPVKINVRKKGEGRSIVEITKE